MVVNSHSKSWPDSPPFKVGSCVDCGCLCLLVSFSDGRVVLLDPGFVDRRWLRSILPPDLVALQGFGSAPNTVEGHVCPTGEGRSLPDRSARSLASKLAGRRRKGGDR